MKAPEHFKLFDWYLPHQVWLASKNYNHHDPEGAQGARADLSWANLSLANLSGANLSRANLSRADLSRAKHIICPPIRDPRGYECVAVNHGSKFIFHAGCHRCTIAEARKHLGKSYKGDREIGDMYLYALDWLKVNQRRLFEKREAE